MMRSFIKINFREEVTSLLPCILELYIIKEYPVLAITINTIIRIFSLFATTIVAITKTSANKLKVGGDAIFAIKIKNQNRGVALHQERIPFLNNNLRE